MIRLPLSLLALPLLLTATAGHAAGQIDAVGRPGIEDLRPRQLSPPDEPVVLPMQMRGSMPAVEVFANGEGPFLFAIDTGAMGAGRVDSSLVERLGLEEVGSIEGSDGTGRPGRRMGVVELESLEIGDLLVEGLRVPTRDYNVSPALPHIDGILGIHLFSELVLTLDFPEREVRIQRDPLEAPEGASRLEITSDPGMVPAIRMTVGGIEIEDAFLDTGKMGGLGVPIAVAEELAWKNEPTVAGRARTVSGEFEVKRGQLDGAVSLGSLEVVDPWLDFSEILTFAVIGSTFLKDYVVSVDQSAGAVWLLEAPDRQ